jgi:hypothetical protein
MSVLVPDTGVFEYVCHGLKRVAYNKTCDEFYSWPISKHFQNKDVDAEAARLVKSWAYLNELSYAVGYNEMNKQFYSAGQITGRKIYNLHPAQLWKYIHCINYNIDIATIDSKQSFRRGEVNKIPDLTSQQRADRILLEEWYVSMAVALAEHTPGYEDAKYSDPVK